MSVMDGNKVPSAVAIVVVTFCRTYRCSKLPGASATEELGLDEAV